MSLLQKWALVLTSMCLVGALSGCVNLFGGVDSPSGDQQLISAARACLDHGDYSCASSEYLKLSSASSDIANSEEAYAIFAEQGAGMQAFASAFGTTGSVNIGTGLTAIAQSILKVQSGQTARVNIYNAFIRYQSITDNANLSALVRFLGSIAFASEILAEIAPAGSTSLTTADVQNNTSIKCQIANNSTEGLASVSANTISAGASYDELNAALYDLVESIDQLSASGSLASSFNSTLSSLGIGLGYGCLAVTTTGYNAILETIGVGGT